jgi:hypothetical protein
MEEQTQQAVSSDAFGTPALTLDPAIEAEARARSGATAPMRGDGAGLGPPDAAAFSDLFGGFTDGGRVPTLPDGGAVGGAGTLPPLASPGHGGSCHVGPEASRAPTGGGVTVGLGGHCDVGGVRVGGEAGINLTDSRGRGSTNPEASGGVSATVPLPGTSARIGIFGEGAVAPGHEGVERKGVFGGVLRGTF